MEAVGTAVKPLQPAGHEVMVAVTYDCVTVYETPLLTKAEDEEAATDEAAADEVAADEVRAVLP